MLPPPFHVLSDQGLRLQFTKCTNDGCTTNEKIRHCMFSHVNGGVVEVGLFPPPTPPFPFAILEHQIRFSKENRVGGEAVCCDTREGLLMFSSLHIIKIF